MKIWCAKWYFDKKCQKIMQHDKKKYLLCGKRGAGGPINVWETKIGNNFLRAQILAYNDSLGKYWTKKNPLVNIATKKNKNNNNK